MKKQTNALAISTLRESENGIKYWVSERYTFTLGDMDEYLKKFKELKEKKYIICENFNENNWILCNQKEDFKTKTIKFPFEFNKELNISIKAFVVVMITTNIDPVTLGQYVGNIVEIIYESNNFDEEIIEEFKEWLSDVAYHENGALKHNWFNSKKTLLKYINFINPPTLKMYEETIESTIKKRTYSQALKPREIPPFEQLLTFDEIVNEFFGLTNDGLERIQECYKPIELWWKITTIIPMRIGEFIRLKFNCIEYDENEKSYYINIPRIKERINVDGENVQITEYTNQRLKIHEDLSDLIENFKKINNSDEEFLFNYNFYYKHIIVPGAQQISSIYAKDKKVLTTDRFRRLLKRFYNDVVIGIYNYDVVIKHYKSLPKEVYDKMVAIQAGDTRHIAISNLTEMGINPLTIAWYCYHDSIKSQDNYSDYLLKEAEVKAKLLAKKIAGEYLRFNDIDLDIRENYIDRLKAKEALQKGGFEISFGVCTSKYGIFECEEVECLFCKSFIPVINKQNKVMVKKIIDAHRVDIANKIHTIQSTIKLFVNTLNKSLSVNDDGSYCGSAKDEANLQTAYNQTIELKNKLAKIEAIDILINKI